MQLSGKGTLLSARSKIRSAGFQPAVSPISPYLRLGPLSGGATQVGNLRYSRLEVCATMFSLPQRKYQRGFTMVEIALSLAVVAFALVAIMGVLPTGMTVEKDNREDTLINQEGRFWLEAIKTGARGLDEITNYVENITIDRMPGTKVEFKNNSTTSLRPADVIGLLSMPKYVGPVTNKVTARLRPITGAAADRSPMRGTDMNTVAFRYQMMVEIVPALPMPEPFVGETKNLQLIQFNEAVGRNLWDVRLVLRWPVVERGTDFFVGNNRKTFRARVLGKPWPDGTLGQSWPAGEVSSSVTNTFPNLTVIRPDQFNVRAGMATQ
jgi:prepilin-type N-terminal cleavage/methylation domain-containing protein